MNRRGINYLLFLGFFCKVYGLSEIEISLDKDCYDNHSLTTAVLTAVYTGSGIVSQVHWYYEHQIAGTYVINASNCAESGPDDGFPGDRMIFNCIESKNFTLTLYDINNELGTEWGARFFIDGGNNSESKLKQITILKCGKNITLLFLAANIAFLY